MRRSLVQPLVFRLAFSFALFGLAPAAGSAQGWSQATPVWFTPRHDPAVAVLNGALYLTSGMRMAMTAVMCNDVWMSRDGGVWTRLTADAPFARRTGAALIAFAGKLFLIGGYDDSYFANAEGDTFREVWISEDGRAWEQIDIGLENPGVQNKEATGRLIAFAAGGQLAIIDNAGADATFRLSSDGKAFTSTVLRGIGEIDMAWYYRGRYFAWSRSESAIYISADGATWRRQSEDAPEFNCKPTEFGGRLFSIDDMDLIVSDDGVLWNPVPGFSDPPGLIKLHERAEAANYSEAAREGAALVVLGDRLWIVGGGLPSWSSSPGVAIGSTTMETDLWSTTDGQIWKRHAAPTDDSLPVPRYAAASAVHNGCLFLMGGMIDPGLDSFIADCWAYDSGAADGSENEGWELKVAAVKNRRWEESYGIWEPRAYAAAASFKGRLWITGGLTRTDYANPKAYTADVWSSADGIIWRREVAAAAFGPRAGHSLVAHNGKLYVIGGESPNPEAPGTITTREDSWESADGVDWRRLEVTAPPLFAAHQAAASAGGRLWLAGGLYRPDENTWATREVWSSADGREWRREPPLRGFAFGLTGAAIGDSFAAIGGRMNADLLRIFYLYGADGEQRTFEAEADPAAFGGLGVSGGKLVYYLGQDDIDGEPSGAVWTLPIAALE